MIAHDRTGFVLRLAVMMILMGVAAPVDLLACTVCYGESDSAMADGINNGILALLAVIGGVQVAFVALFVSFRKRAKQLRAARDGGMEDDLPRSSEGTLS